MFREIKWLILVVILLLGMSYALAQPKDYSEKYAANRQRICIPAAGAPVTLSINTSTAQSSGLLKNEASYKIRCSVKTRLRWAATDIAAIATDDWLPADSLFHFGTGGPENIRYVNALADLGTGECSILECR